jgi:hypothetical protein
LKKELHRILKMRNRIHCEQKCEYWICKEKTLEAEYEEIYILKLISVYFLRPCFFLHLMCAHKKIWRHRCSSLTFFVWDTYSYIKQCHGSRLHSCSNKQLYIWRCIWNSHTLVHFSRVITILTCQLPLHKSSTNLVTDNTKWVGLAGPRTLLSVVQNFHLRNYRREIDKM